MFLNCYIILVDTTLNDAENLLQADNKKNGGLGIVLNVDTDLSDKIAEDFGEGLHLDKLDLKLCYVSRET